VTYTGADPTVCWGNGFRGGGWDGSAMITAGFVNNGITLIVEELP
jgi:hypothetical protein